MKKLIKFGSGFAAALFLVTGIVWAQTIPPGEQPTKIPDPLATPTIDRLAAPPTVIPPTQADDGAQLYWLWCQPCHGDRGQGLTEEWREQYPPEDQYCWGRGCHGERPYEEGFVLPKQVPAVVGKGTLLRYQTMGELYEYVQVEMPFEYPGVLNDEEALAVTAFLAQQHGNWDGTRLTVENVDEIGLQPTPEPVPAISGQSGEDATGSVVESGLSFISDNAFLVGGLLLGSILLGGFWIWRRKGY